MSANKTTDTVLLYSGGVEPRIPSVFLADHSQRGLNYETGTLVFFPDATAVSTNSLASRSLKYYIQFEKFLLSKKKDLFFRIPVNLFSNRS